jgi:hypothetical protein
MLELEQRIAAWRVKVMKALDEREDLVDELEDHLREDFACHRAKNISSEESFTLAATRLGDAQDLATQFENVRPEKRPFKMKTLRIVVTTFLGCYLLAMGLQLIAVTYLVVQELAGFTPPNSGASTAFFPNLLVCSLCAIGIWATWRGKRRAESK